MSRPAPDRAFAAPYGAFPAARHEQWRALAAEEVGEGSGWDPAAALFTADDQVAEALVPRPLVLRERPAGLAEPSWCVLEEIGGPEAELGARVAEAMAGGAHGVRLVAPPEGLDDWVRMLRGLEPKAAGELRWHLVGPRAAGAARALAETLGTGGTRPWLSIADDPPSQGKAGLEPAAEDRRARAVVWHLEQGFDGPAWHVDASYVHRAGGGEALELGALLAGWVHALRSLEARGVDGGATFGRASFHLELGRDWLNQAAKLRAARWLFERVRSHLGLPGGSPWVVAATSLLGHSRIDPWSNALRSGAAAIAGALGGADALVVRAYDALAGQPSARGRRLARGTQLVLAQEGGLGRVADPLGGSFAVEARTRALAEAAWEVFREIEADGGLSAVLGNGSLLRRAREEAAPRAAALARRRARLVGVNGFLPPPDAEVLTRGAAKGGSGGWPTCREAEPFEELRERGAALRREGRLPAVLVLGLGPRAEHRARAETCRELFGLGGFEVGYQAGADAAAAEASARRWLSERPAGPRPLICLAAANERLSALAEQLCRALAELGPQLFVVSPPAELQGALGAFGAQALDPGADLFELLEPHLAARELPSKEVGR